MYMFKIKYHDESFDCIIIANSFRDLGSEMTSRGFDEVKSIDVIEDGKGKTILLSEGVIDNYQRQQEPTI